MKAAMLDQGRNKSTRSAVYVLWAQTNVSLLSWVKGELGGWRQEAIIYQIIYMKWMQKSVRRRRNERERGEERE
jgi:hypothetical protein